MLFGNRGPGSPTNRRRGAFKPTSERLEERKLMAVQDLANIDSGLLGVQEVGAVANDGAGYSVANVGDVTNSGYDSFLISSPTINAVTGNGTTTGTGQSKVYLVFGSAQVNSTNAVNFLNLVPNQRIGDLTTLGQINQVNPAIIPPTDGSPIGFNYDGIVFTTNSTSNSLVGASVAGVGDINGDNINDFVIGAPNDGNGGSAYIVFGGSNLRTSNVTNVNLSAVTGPTKIIKVTSSVAGDQVGFGVGGVGKFLSRGSVNNDVAIGAPGTLAGSGAVYVLSGAGLTSTGSGTTIDVATIGANGGIGVTYNGQANDRAGASVTTAGNFDGTVQNGRLVSSLLIGAPGPVAGTGAAFSAGRAYLIYGDQTVNGTPFVTIANGSSYNLSLVGLASTTAIPNPIIGAVFNGISTGRLGFSVSTAGDFDGDGIDDLMIGSPGSSTTAGFAAVIYGVSGTARPYGSFRVDPVATSSLRTQYFVSETPTDLAGYSIAPIQNYNGEELGILRGIAIGAPGFVGNLGAVYTIPSTFAGSGVVSLAQIAPSFTGARLTLTGSLPSNPPALGTSISTRPLFAASPFYTVDQDPLDDLIVGAPGYSLIDPTTNSSSVRPLSGSGFAVSGLKILDRINPSIGVNSLTPTFTANPNSTNNILIYVFSTLATPTQPAFAPVTQLNQNSVFINGIAIPSLTNFTSVPDANGDGIPEASFTVTPAQINLAGSTLTNFPILLAGLTTANLPFVGSTQVLLSGTGGGGGGGGGGGTVIGAGGILSTPLFAPRSFSGTDGGELAPGIETLEHLNSYQPLPASVAYEQFLAAPGFRARQQLFEGKKAKGKLHQAPAGTSTNDRFSGVNVLPSKVFTRGKFKKGQTINFTHKVKVIPRNRQSDSFTSF